MLEFPETSLSWQKFALGILASLLTGGGLVKFYNTWLNSRLGVKKLPSEIDISEAQAVKTRAEGRKLNADADVQFSEIIERLHVRIDQMQDGVDEIRAERDEFKLRCELQQIELRMRDTDIKKLKGALDFHNIKLSDFDQTH